MVNETGWILMNVQIPQTLIKALHLTVNSNKGAGCTNHPLPNPHPNRLQRLVPPMESTIDKLTFLDDPKPIYRLPQGLYSTMNRQKLPHENASLLQIHGPAVTLLYGPKIENVL